MQHAHGRGTGTPSFVCSISLSTGSAQSHQACVRLGWCSHRAPPAAQDICSWFRGMSSCHRVPMANVTSHGKWRPPEADALRIGHRRLRMDKRLPIGHRCFYPPENWISAPRPALTHLSLDALLCLSLAVSLSVSVSNRLQFCLGLTRCCFDERDNP